MLNYNNFYNYITGLKNNRFAYEVGSGAEAQSDSTEKEPDVTDKKGAEVIATDVGDQIRKNAATAKEQADDATKLGTVANDSIQDKYRRQKHMRTATGGLHPTHLEADAPLAGEEKPIEKELTHEQKVAKLEQRVKDNADVANLYAMTDKPKPSYEPADTEAEYAANEPEAKSTEMAYLQKQMENASDSMVADYVAISKRLDEALLIPGTTVENAVTELKDDIPRLTADIGYIGEVAKAIQARGEKVNAESIVEGLKAIATNADTKDKLDKQYNLLNS